MRKLNLNNYIVTKEDDAALTIIPHVTPDGVQMPAMFFKSTRTPKFKITLENMEVSSWHPKILIDVDGTPDDYITLVNWWFDGAKRNVTYRDNLNATFKNLKGLADNINRAQGWLQQNGAFSIGRNGKFNSRKKEIGKFLNGWLNRSLDKQIRFGR